MIRNAAGNDKLGDPCMTHAGFDRSKRAPKRLPFWLKLAYSALMARHDTIYWHYYGPTNFLYFCDMALILTLGSASGSKARC